MRFLIVLMLLATCVGAVPVDPDPDGMGMYFDTEGVNSCIWVDDWVPAIGAGPNITVYLLVTHPDTPYPSIQAWEAHVEFITNSYTPPSGLTLPALAVDYDGDLDDYVVGCGGAAAIPITGDATVIAWADLTWLGYEGSASATCLLRGVDGSQSFPEGPGYAAEAGFPSPCHSLWGIWGPVSWINGLCPTANESMTWGSVKSLY